MRISVNLGPQIVKRVEEESKKLGTTRSSLLAMWVNEKVNSLDISKQIAQGIFENESFKKLLAEAIAEKGENC